MLKYLTHNSTYTGNLSITLNDALTFTVPNEQLLFNETFIAAGKGLIQTKGDVMTIPVVRSDILMPRIGAMFFSVAYLMVNNDKEQFTISQAQPTPATQKLIGIDTANSCISAANVVGADPTTPSASPTTSSSSSSASSAAPDAGSPGLSSGAIAGIAVGAVGGIALIAGILFFVWRRRRQTGPPSDSGMPLGAQVPVEKYGHDTSEMYTDTAVTELGHGDARQYAVELDGAGRPLEAPAYGLMSPHEAPRRS